MIHALFNWFEHAIGMTNGSGPEYLFWSGFGSDLGEFALIGTIIGCLAHWYKSHECYDPTCPRYGAHHTPDGMRTCSKHHPSLGSMK
jgi:hypothetical protein